MSRSLLPPLLRRLHPRGRRAATRTDSPIVAARALLPWRRPESVGDVVSPLNNWLHLIRSRHGSSDAGHDSEGLNGKIRWGGEWNDEFGHQYARIGGPIDGSICKISEKEIHKLISERIECRRKHEFQRADDIREELRRAGVFVNDAAKAWRADGVFWFPSAAGGPKMSDCRTIDEAIQKMHGNIDHAHPRDVAAFWSVVPRLLRDHQRSGRQQFLPQLKAIFDKTLEGIEKLGRRDLTQTALAIAKIANSTGRGARGSYHQFLRDAIEDRRADVFQPIATAAAPILSQFEPRQLSNLAYAYALVDYVPRFEDGTQLFDHIAEESIPSLAEFNPQDVSNLVWAFARVGASHPFLFPEVSKHMVDRSLGSFKPQEIADMVWAYATADVNNPHFFTRVGGHIVEHVDLHEFDPRELSVMVWAFAKTDVTHWPLFRKVEKHVESPDRLRSFTPQMLSNIVWAYAKVKFSARRLFHGVADRIVEFEDIEDFTTREILKVESAFRRARVSHPGLLEKLAQHPRVEEWDGQDSLSTMHLQSQLWKIGREPKVEREAAKRRRRNRAIQAGQVRR